jgi:hypothetical protein
MSEDRRAPGAADLRPGHHQEPPVFACHAVQALERRLDAAETRIKRTEDLLQRLAERVEEATS